MGFLSDVISYRRHVVGVTEFCNTYCSLLQQDPHAVIIPSVIHATETAQSRLGGGAHRMD